MLQLMLNLEQTFLTHWKIEIHMFVPNTEQFLNAIREPIHRFSKYPICINYLQVSSCLPYLQNYAGSQVHSQQRGTCRMIKSGRDYSMKIQMLIIKIS